MQKHRKIEVSLYYASAATVMGLLLAGTSALAQQPKPVEGDQASANQTFDAAEIIVTAQKRSERVSDVPISITAITGGQLKALGITSPNDLTKIATGLTFGKTSLGIPVYTIRGVGLDNDDPSSSPTVSVYIDQIPLPYLAMTEGVSLDAERVEVLKGPQGTLFGQNSTGGAVNYIAAKPTPSLKAGINLAYGRFNELGAEGYISGPLTETLSARLAIRHERRDDWQRSETRPDDTLGRRNFTTGRLLLDWQPSGPLQIELNLNGWRDTSDTQAGQFVRFQQVIPSPPGNPASAIALAGRVPAPDQARVADWDPNISFARNDRFGQAALKATYRASDNFNITSITAYSAYRTRAPADMDGTDFNALRMLDDGDITSFYQELRGDAEISTVKLLFGVNYQHDDIRGAIRAHYKGSNSQLGPFIGNSWASLGDQNVKTYAVFGSTDIPLTSKLTAQAAIRYTKQDRSFKGCLADGGDGAFSQLLAFVATLVQPGHAFLPQPPGACVSLDPVTADPTGFIHDNLNEDNVSWRVGLNYKPWRGILLYGNVTKGFKSGAFTPLPAVFAPELKPVTQESVLAYEIGVKAPLFDRRVQFAAAAFYYDYSDKQLQSSRVFPLFGPLPTIENIPSAHVEGFEVELTARPTNRLRTTVGVSRVVSKVDGDAHFFNPYGAFVDLKEESFPNTPRWQANGDAQYDFPVNGSLNAFIGGHLSYRSNSNAAFGRLSDFVLPSVKLLDLRAGVEDASGNWRVQVWGRNVTNEFYATGVSYRVDATKRLAGMPATYGVTLSADF